MTPAADTLGTPPARDDAGEAEAWARVLAAWDDAEAHRAYLARCADLDALARAGRRYRAVLDARPDDPTATRAIADILGRATVQGLASLPRTPPPRAVPPRLRRLAVVVLAVLLAALAFAAARGIAAALGARS